MKQFVGLLVATSLALICWSTQASININVDAVQEERCVSVRRRQKW